jgi:3'5'-cyclic nucleotide phosphodiesterase
VIGPQVRSQLQAYVLQISQLYRPSVPFHNFEHASHVIMSAGKLMERIVNPEGINYSGEERDIAREIHFRTYGISSDPMIQLAVVFSALIHDADHTGLTNCELVELQTETAKKYRSKSVAEQNSVDLAWGILMQPRYSDLRSCLYTNEQELRRFRQLLVNAVMATDIADKVRFFTSLSIRLLFSISNQSRNSKHSGKVDGKELLTNLPQVKL